MAKKPQARKAAEAEEIVPPKIKREFDLEGHEIFAGDKLDEAEVLDEAVDPEDAEDAAELDAEEIDPFKDKWEE